MNTNATLIQAANLLMRSNPTAWDHFMRGLNEQLDKLGMQLVNAPPEVILVHQGQVRSLAVLAADLANARDLAEKLATSPAKRK